MTAFLPSLIHCSAVLRRIRLDFLEDDRDLALSRARLSGSRYPVLVITVYEMSARRLHRVKCIAIEIRPSQFDAVEGS